MVSGITTTAEIQEEGASGRGASPPRRTTDGSTVTSKYAEVKTVTPATKIAWWPRVNLDLLPNVFAGTAADRNGLHAVQEMQVPEMVQSQEWLIPQENASMCQINHCKASLLTTQNSSPMGRFGNVEVC